MVLRFFKLHVHTVQAVLDIALKLDVFYYYYSVFSIGFEVHVGSWEVDVPKAKCKQHFAETGNLTELN